MLILRVHVAESGLIAYKGVLAEIATGTQVAEIMGSLGLLLVADLLLELEPLGLELHYLFTVGFLLHFELGLAVLDCLLELGCFVAILFEFLSEFLVAAFSLRE